MASFVVHLQSMDLCILATNGKSERLLWFHRAARDSAIYTEKRDRIVHGCGLTFLTRCILEGL